MTEEVTEKKAARETDDAKRATAYLTALFEKMNLAIETHATLDGKFLRLNLTGDDSLELIQGKGATARSDVMEALQLIVSRTLYSSDRGRTVIIDAGGFRKDRLESLRGVADRIAKVAGVVESVEIYGMNSFDRRGIHVRLQESREAKTDSAGYGALRHLIVTKPQKKRNPEK